MNTFITTLLLVTQMNVQYCLHQEELNLALIELKNEQQNYFLTQNDGVLQSDFELEGGLIFLKAKLNGQAQSFIFDTGSPHLILNNNRSSSQAGNPFTNKSNLKINGVGGSKKISKVRNPDFDWNGINAKWKTCYATDMQNIARVKKRDFAGLIGYDQMRKHEVVIDYKKQKLFLVSRSNKTFFDNHEKIEKVPLRMMGHLPVVKVKIGKRRYYFAIDSGAEVNVIDKRLRKRMSEKMIVESLRGNIIGGGDKKISARGVKIKSTKIGKATYENLDYTYADLSFLTDDEGHRVDGLLGYPFLKEALFSINYRKRQLCKWELKTKDNQALELAVTKKNIKLTKSLSHRN